MAGRVAAAIATIARVELQDDIRVRIGAENVPRQLAFDGMKVMKMRVVTNGKSKRLQLRRQIVELIRLLNPHLFGFAGHVRHDDKLVANGLVELDRGL